MSLELSLYKIEDDLLSLLELRDEAALENDLDALKAIDGQLIEYAKAEVRKADGIAHHWRNFEARIAAKKAEAERLWAEAKLDVERLARLKAAVQFAMESFEWRTGKPRVIEGKTCKLYLKANGGRPAVEISDESLIPDELKFITVRMSFEQWMKLGVPAFAGKYVDTGPPMPSLALIAEQLNKPCESCEGRGHQRDPVFEEHISPDTCGECRGTGKQSVPGARFAAAGQHVECK